MSDAFKSILGSTATSSIQHFNQCLRFILKDAGLMKGQLEFRIHCQNYIALNFTLPQHTIVKVRVVEDIKPRRAMLNPVINFFYWHREKGCLTFSIFTILAGGMRYITITKNVRNYYPSYWCSFLMFVIVDSILTHGHLVVLCSSYG